MTFNFIVLKYMLTTVQDYDDINWLTFHIMLSSGLKPPFLNSLSGNNANIFRREVHFSVKRLDPKARK